MAGRGRRGAGLRGGSGPEGRAGPDDTAEVIAQRLALYYEVTAPIIAWYRDRGILVSVDAMRSAPEVWREILAALEAMRPFLDDLPAQERLPADLTSLGEAFGATGPAASSDVSPER